MMFHKNNPLVDGLTLDAALPALLRDPHEEFLFGLRVRGMALDLDAASHA
jgi:hypothetical protein